jgi:hypothetical protein
MLSGGGGTVSPTWGWRAWKVASRLGDGGARGLFRVLEAPDMLPNLVI